MILLQITSYSQFLIVNFLQCAPDQSLQANIMAIFHMQIRAIDFTHTGFQKIHQKLLHLLLKNSSSIQNSVWFMLTTYNFDQGRRKNIIGVVQLTSICQEEKFSELWDIQYWRCSHNFFKPRFLTFLKLLNLFCCLSNIQC